MKSKQSNFCLCPIATVNSQPLIDKVISTVKGGTTASAAAMKSQLSKTGVLNWSHYVEWAATLTSMPALIHSDVNIHSLIEEHLHATYSVNIHHF